MTQRIPWMYNETFNPDIEAEEVQSSEESTVEEEEQSTFWDNMIFPI